MSEFATPVGRLVQGSVLRGNTKNRKGETLTDKSGNARTNYFLALAFPKTAAGAGGAWWNEGEFFASIYREGMRGYPQFFNPDGSCKKRDFSWKVIDGDGIDDDGNPNNQKAGFAGHWVVRFSNGFCPKLWMNGGYVVNEQAVKTGYFVRVFGDMKDNSPSESPGVYLNHSGVEFVAYGEEIVSGPDLGAMVRAAGAVTALPAGATLTPPTPQHSAMPNAGGPAAMPAMPGVGGPTAMPQMPAVQQQQPAMPGLPPMPGSMPTPSNLTPNHAFVQNAIGPGAMPAMPQMPAMTPPPPAAPVYAMTAAAGGFTREQWHANGTTDEQLLQAGYMIRTA